MDFIFIRKTIVNNDDWGMVLAVTEKSKLAVSKKFSISVTPK